MCIKSRRLVDSYMILKLVHRGSDEPLILYGNQHKLGRETWDTIYIFFFIISYFSLG